MNKLLSIGIGIGILSILLFGFVIRWERIDAGHAGVVVNLYGDGKGVDDVALATGMVWYMPYKTMVYEVPTYVRNAVYTESEDEGSESNEEFRVTTADGLVVRFDVALNYSTPRDNVVKIFEKYRKPPSELENTIFRNYTRKGFNRVAANYTAEELYEKREQFMIDSEKAIRNILEEEGFQIEQVVLLNDLRLPKSVQDNIERKVEARQIALRMEEEVRQKQYEANSRIEDARGKAESMKIKADAERYAYEQKTKELTPLLIQQQFIEKWNGQLPTYMTPDAMGLFKGINK